MWTSEELFEPGPRTSGVDVLPAREPGATRRTIGADAHEFRSTWEHVFFYAFIIGPLAAVVGGAVLWGRGYGLPPLTIGLFVGTYVVTGLGVTVGYHRLLTHRSFTAARPLRIALAVAGSMAIQGGVIRWVADHRKHHQYSDAPGDPHSPWRYGTGAAALTRGLWWAHTGWLFSREQAVKQRYAPDLAADPDMTHIHRLFPLWVSLSVLLPPAVAFTATQSWRECVDALIWASLVRIFLLHHVTFAINSICHVTGRRPHRSRDRSTNVWPLALLSFGESWHNGHHSDPTSARHGLGRGQIDLSAMLIRFLERVGWARDVRWPNRRRRTPLSRR
jgi:stearoyl-CoA desaturase (delta-9 desaturase)